MAISDVTVTIDLAKAAGSAGFGFPLILEEKTTSGVAYKECASLSEVATAGFADGTDVYKAAALMFAQDGAPNKIAVCGTTGLATAFLADEENTNKGWRQIMIIRAESEGSTISDLMTAVEGLDNKMYFVGLDTDDTTELTVTNVERTVLFYVDATATVAHPEAALIGASAGRSAGSFSYKNLKLTGIAAQELTSAEITAIHGKGGITFVNKAGDGVTSEGKTAGGEYIDIIDSEDYVISELTYKTQKTLNNLPKVPYDNNGIATLESVAVDVMKSAYDNGMIATNADGSPAYNVSYALREDCAASDISLRKYLGGTFSFKLAGAIHEVTIHGEIIA